ncbi:MAG: hypothetical protein PW791_15365 [Neorhizobium sp.]|nr:hypothetical protein [Neorhizobium sp.]
MSRFAVLLMFLAWLLYGAMPATAMPMGDSPMTGMDMSDMAGGIAPHAMTGMMHDHGGSTGSSNRASGAASGRVPITTAPAAKVAAIRDAPHCPHGGKVCVAPFCAACLTLLPELVFIDGRAVAYRYPAPGLVPDRPSNGPSPATPPPRA